MTRAAFYAPLKAPDHPVPSGDREMARALLAALAHGGIESKTVSHLRLYDGKGDAARQTDLMAQARAEIARLVPLLTGKCDLWITYHNYYKSPDLIGPAVARKMGVPYVQIETSRARSRLTGPWARFAEAAEAASDAAGLIFYLTRLDGETLERDRAPGQRLIHLAPFLQRDDPGIAAKPGTGKRILTVAMMRDDVKRLSYGLIAQTLPRLKTADWHLTLVGDGPARTQIEDEMARFAPHVTFLGRLDRADLEPIYCAHDIFFWPGVNEAYGMAYLEAQAAGLPVVAQSGPGVQEVVPEAQLVPVAEGPAGMARALDLLTTDDALRLRRGAEARRTVTDRHLLPAAAATLSTGIAALTEAAQ
ncbi:glycosyltransferase family 4 protein [Chachezhania antarctica]|uniref:glycosyltransferase family 4 protein n=1 Tax=Chachezhania antarctica TaxID=2340860 RepID=UPI000EB0FE79|nr:glycosyltransferase family 4 protein [Chachezhania antarctica]|tara:strand:+ start:2610 stop:3695 length:1086 start_codon:yes stop_codon:yes gene_type:complete